MKRLSLTTRKRLSLPILNMMIRKRERTIPAVTMLIKTTPEDAQNIDSAVSIKIKSISSGDAFLSYNQINQNGYCEEKRYGL